jgi:hypothetical protein
LAYTDFREADDSDDQDERIIPPDAASRIDEIMRLEQTDGVNRDDQLRSIVTEAIMRQVGRGENGNNNGTGYGRRRRENED